ncbi:MAG: TetR/AcrR family transcriptional regulator [Alphaproteobacteria bacterium]|nr:TetR/AcrR family transcriptional regulator [Alphaproteobacteria bacterium]
MPGRQHSLSIAADTRIADRTDDASFETTLLRAADAPALRKSERTRLRLLAAIASRLAAGDDPTALRVSDIADAAGLAHGTFYRYFTDRQEAVEALIADFTRFQRERLAAIRDGAPGSPERVRAATLGYVRLFRRNAGLMRCLMGLGPETAAFRARFHALNRDWNARVAAAIAGHRARLSGTLPAAKEALLPTAYALGGMIDEFLTQIYLRRDPALAALEDDETAIAELLTELWCRAAYVSDAAVR